MLAQRRQQDPDLRDHLQYRAFFAQQNRLATTPAAPGFGVISTDGIHRDRPFTRDEEAALLAYLRKL